MGVTVWKIDESERRNFALLRLTDSTDPGAYKKLNRPYLVLGYIIQADHSFTRKVQFLKLKIFNSTIT